eukprot:TRINITY_DN1551_c0_g2_i1.p1 TRINITY_DN1551_c0_g2~~TRINITY_DN1551_c0_g2_i1.p1  ORF type:complete len:676 (+),score=199.09 TRINITY_DN1551_c0_g2_i1:459-2486(+)
MSRDAVKFGRMSKKQREKVEDEVRYHKEMNSQQGGGLASGRSSAHNGNSPDSSCFDSNQQPSSTDMSYEGSGASTGFSYGADLSPYSGGYAFTSIPPPPPSHPASQPGGGAEWTTDYGNVDSTTSPFDSRSNPLELQPPPTPTSNNNNNSTSSSSSSSNTNGLSEPPAASTPPSSSSSSSITTSSSSSSTTTSSSTSSTTTSSSSGSTTCINSTSTTSATASRKPSEASPDLLPATGLKAQSSYGVSSRLGMTIKEEVTTDMMALEPRGGEDESDPLAMGYDVDSTSSGAHNNNNYANPASSSSSQLIHHPHSKSSGASLTSSQHGPNHQHIQHHHSQQQHHHGIHHHGIHHHAPHHHTSHHATSPHHPHPVQQQNPSHHIHHQTPQQQQSFGSGGMTQQQQHSSSHDLYLLQEELQNDPDRIGVLLTNSIFEAHTRTSLLTRGQIHEQWKQGVDQVKLYTFKNMSQEELWLCASQKLTNIIQQIIEFAKMVPGFMKFPQDDQITLLKGGAFELAVIRMSRYFDPSQNAVLFFDVMLPMECFMTTGDTGEMNLVNQIFDLAKGLAELQLSEVTLALYSAYILLQEDRTGLKSIEEIRKLNQAVFQTLQRELTNRPPLVPTKGDVSVLTKLLNKRHTLREINFLHTEALTRFRSGNGGMIEFPALYRELFSSDHPS